MSNKEFEVRIMTYLDGKFDNIDGKFEVISKDISILKTDVSWLKNKFNILDNKFDVLDNKFNILDNKFDRLDDSVYEQTSEIKQEIRLQWAYLNQAFDRMSYMQNNVCK